MKPLRVLIVDDEPAARVRLRRLLEELDVECVGEAANARRGAGPRRPRCEPDVLLLDIAMPEVSGLDVARHLQRAPSADHLPDGARRARGRGVRAGSDRLPAEAGDARSARAGARSARRGAWPRAPEDPPSDALARVQRAALPPAAPARRLLVRAGAGHRLLPVREIARFTADEGLARAIVSSATRFSPTTP